MSEKNTKAFDIIIVGCGPVGATLANLLRLQGFTVGIFERFKEVFYAPRAMGVDDESKRIFQGIGILDRMVNEGHLKLGTAWFYSGNGKELMEMSEPSIGLDLLTKKNGHSFIGIFDQPACERMLREEFEKGTEITTYFGYDIVSLSDNENHASVTAKNLDTDEEQTFLAKYVIGCDGANSIVQKEISTEFHSYHYNEQYLVVDAIVEDKTYLDTMLPEGAIWFLDSRRSGVLAKGLHGHVRLDFLLRKNAEIKERDYEKEVKSLIEARGLDAGKFEVFRQSPYQFSAKTPKKWRKGHFIIAGDAAHLTPPWAAQGLNMGFRDTLNLAFKLNLVLKGKVGDKILDTYQMERLDPVLHTIKSAVKTGKLMTDKNPLSIGLRNFIYYLSRKSRFIRHLIFKDWQARPPYKKGLIGHNHRLAGSVMIQPKVINPRVEDINKPLIWLDDLIGLRFALISIGSSFGKEIYTFMKDWDGKVIRYNTDFSDPSGEFLKWFNQHKVKHVIIRPDKRIFDAGNDANALCQSLIHALNLF